MAKSPEIRVNPELLIWARESIGIEIPDVAKKLGVKEELVESWERGEKPLTYIRLENLADFYKRPVAALFLPKAPPDFVTPTDFRTSTKNLAITKELRRAIRHARMVRNAFVAINPKFKKFDRKKISLDFDVDKLADLERERLGITFSVQKSWKAGKGALDNWTKLLEENGIIVLQSSFPTKELSGFSIKEDDKPPVIVLNSNDVYARKIFTIFHEYCHLLIQSTGICKIKIDSEEFQKNTSVESYCDKFSSAFLVPKEIFFSHSDIKSFNSGDQEDSIKKLADTFKVSRQVILLRLYLARIISQSYYDQKKSKYDDEFRTYPKEKKERERKSPGGPPPYIMSVSQNGKLFSRAVIQAYREGRISNKDFSSYTGVKLDHLSNIESLI